MAAQPSTSKESAFQELENCMSNIESARFLKRVLQKAEQEKKGARFRSTFERATSFTGLHSKVFIDQNISTIVDSEIKDIERSIIHDRLMYFYINKQTVPTTTVLFESLFGRIPRYVDIRSFRKHLASMGYIWAQAGKIFVVIERPEVTFERYFYLKDIVKYRQENREIFYVDETILTTDGGYYNVARYNKLKKVANQVGKNIFQDTLVKNIYAVSKNGVIAVKHINGTNKSDEFTRDTFENWIINDLVPVLTKNSVVVIKNDKHHQLLDEKPTLYALKTDMMKWLDNNNVPYDKNMSKCELLALIDIYTTSNDRMDKIETVLQCNGHTLLRLPFTCEKTSLSHYIFELIKQNAPKAKRSSLSTLSNLCDAITVAQLQKYDANVAELEEQTLQVDIKVDEILDDILSRMGTVHMRGDADSEVPLSDSD